MTYPNAAAGLKTMYQAKLVGLISIVPVFFPIIQVFAAAALLVADILTLIGLYQCRKDDSGCRTAFTLVIVQLVTNLLSRFIPGIIDTIFAGNRCSGTGIAVLCMHHHSANGNRWRRRADHRPGCRGMEDQCHLHRHYDGMPADSNDSLGDIMYTLFLRDPYRTLVFHVPPEMHADQVV